MGWEQLLDIAREAADLAAQEAASPPVACPQDGEPLLTGPNGVLYCRFCGWTHN